MVKTKLIKYRLYEENGRLYMRLMYEHEDEHRVTETEILKVDTCIYTDCEPTISTSISTIDECDEACMECGGITYPVLRVDTGDVYGKIRLIHRVIREKPTEMTLEEIEKKLGYKVKIVSEKEK